MKNILQTIQNRLAEIPELQYIDEDWGQLDYYSSNPPTKFPCALIDINSGQFSDIGKDPTKRPKQRQMGIFSLKISLANLKLTNTSFKSPQSQKNSAWESLNLIESIHKKLHGFFPTDNASVLSRKSFARIMREDGIQEYSIIYSFEIQNV